MDDTFLTIATTAEGLYTEKGSRFLASAHHVQTPQEVKAIVDSHRKQYYDARHVCYAYMLGQTREQYRASDDGEPSGTAGRPILGQINSRTLTDTLVVVVRYFGGTKLGTSGLIRAYKTASAQALDNAQTELRTLNHTLTATFEFPLLSQVMRIVKEEQPTLLSQDFQLQCTLTMLVRQARSAQLAQRLSNVRGVSVKVETGGQPLARP